jgi:ADP-L-glycero-D-manno-heptose 6-epimerase
MIYVTGAAGFIGSHLVEKLKSDDHKVEYCDIRDSKMIQPEDLLYKFSYDKPSVVFHLGAISSTTETNTAAITENNIHLSCKILEFCLKENIPLVYASSASVYGLGDHGFSEDEPCTPLNYYAISKTSFDTFVLQKIKDNPLSRVFGLRYFNVYGNNEDHKGDMASPIHKFIKQSRDLGKIKVFKGSEFFLRDFVHVDDVIAITCAAERFNTPGIYNVGTGVSRSFMDVANNIASLTGCEVIEVPFPKRLVGKYQKYTKSDNTKIDSAGYDCRRISLEEGIKRTLKL